MKTNKDYRPGAKFSQRHNLNCLNVESIQSKESMLPKCRGWERGDVVAPTVPLWPRELTAPRLYGQFDRITRIRAEFLCNGIHFDLPSS